MFITALKILSVFDIWFLELTLYYRLATATNRWINSQSAKKPTLSNKICYKTLFGGLLNSYQAFILSLRLYFTTCVGDTGVGLRGQEVYVGRLCLFLYFFFYF